MTLRPLLSRTDNQGWPKITEVMDDNGKVIRLQRQLSHYVFSLMLWYRDHYCCYVRLTRAKAAALLINDPWDEYTYLGASTHTIAWFRRGDGGRHTLRSQTYADNEEDYWVGIDLRPGEDSEYPNALKRLVEFESTVRALTGI